MQHVTMNPEALKEIKDSIVKLTGNEYKHYFLIERPAWDDQNLYNDVIYRVESKGMEYSCTLTEMITDEQVKIMVEYLRSEFKLPIYTWKKIMVEYGNA